MAQEVPSSARMEQALLGSIFVYNDVLTQCRDMDLSAKEFYVPAHEKIFQAMEDLSKIGKPVGVDTVLQHLTDTGQLESVGGAGYLADLLAGAVSGASAGVYIETIKNKAQLRSLIDAAGKIQESAFGASGDIDIVLDDAERAIMDVTRHRRGTEFMKSQDVVQEVFEEIEALRKGKGVSGIPTGYSAFDNMTNGLHAGELLILAARPAMGKSALALNFANQVAKRNDGAVAIFSLEMPAASLMKRLIASEGEIEGSKLTSGKLTDAEMNAMYDAGNLLSERKLYIDDTSMIKVSQIFSKCRKLKSEAGSLSLIVIDYLQLISGSGRSDSRQQEVSEISRNLKILAKEMECPVLALSQLSRKVEERNNHEPQLSDLRESGSIEQDADIVMFLYRSQYYKKDEEVTDQEVVELSLKKHRNGSTGTVPLVFRKSCSLFTTADPSMLSGVPGQ